MAEQALNLLLVGANAETRRRIAGYITGQEPQEITLAVPFVEHRVRRPAPATARLLHIWHGLELQADAESDMSMRFSTSAMSYILNSHATIVLADCASPTLEHTASQHLRLFVDAFGRQLGRYPIALVVVTGAAEARAFSPQDGQTVCNRVATRIAAQAMTYHEHALAPSAAWPALVAALVERMPQTTALSVRGPARGAVAPPPSRLARCMDGEDPRMAATPLLTLWMLKRGEIVRNWKRRCFRIFDDGAALYYEDGNDLSTLRGSFQLQRAQYFARSDRQCDGILWPKLLDNRDCPAPDVLFFGLQPVSGTRVYYLVCHDNEDASRSMVTYARLLAVLQRFDVAPPDTAMPL
eukprot:m.134792 g.134792  ORF g.134792 m.134792 type:complete len:353 (+) comp14853_c0_seq2:309-1367(+)